MTICIKNISCFKRDFANDELCHSERLDVNDGDSGQRLSRAVGRIAYFHGEFHSSIDVGCVI